MKITFFPELEEDMDQSKRSPIGFLVNIDPSDKDDNDQGISVKIGNKEVKNPFIRALVVFLGLLLAAVIIVIVAVLLPVIMLIVSVILLVIAVILAIAAFIAPFLVLFGLGKTKIEFD